MPSGLGHFLSYYLIWIIIAILINTFGQSYKRKHSDEKRLWESAENEPSLGSGQDVWECGAWDEPELAEGFHPGFREEDDQDVVVGW